MELSVGGKKVTSIKLQKTINWMDRNIKSGLTNAVLILERDIKLKLSGQYLNVQTGRLRSSITHEVKKDGNGFYGKVGTNVVYAPPHEFGSPSRNLPARHFMRDAMKDNAAKVKKALLDSITGPFR